MSDEQAPRSTILADFAKLPELLTEARAESGKSTRKDQGTAPQKKKTGRSK
jgi:hypothetical protein